MSATNNNNNNKGKFINAFQSIQMIGDYEGDEEEKPVTSAEAKKNPPNIHATKTDEEEAVYKGDELYNPLEADDSSDDDDEDEEDEEEEEEEEVNDKTIGSEKSKSPSKRKPSQTSNLNTALENNGDDVTKRAPSIEISRETSKGIDDNSNNDDDMLVEDVNLEIEFNNEYSDEFQISKSPERPAESSGDGSNSRSAAVDDDDDLLGTALAELEQEEREAELQKLLEKERRGGDKRKDSKKKKKKKSRSMNNTDKKKNKKKKKKKAKEKNKEKDAGGSDDEKDEQKKKDKKKKEERRKSLPPASEDARKVETKNYKQNDSMNVKPVTKDKPRDEKVKDTSSSSSLKHSKTKQREKSPPKKRDKKRRDSSQERKEKRKNSDEHSNNKPKHSTKDEKTEPRHKDSSHKSKDRRSDTSEHRSRKRSHRDPPSDGNDKRSRKLTDTDKKKDKNSSALHTKETISDRKRVAHREDDNTERDARRSHEDSTSKHSSHKHRRHSISDTRSKVEDELKSPLRNKHNDSKTPNDQASPILSKDQFFQAQNEARKEDKRKHHRYSDSENECEKLLRTASFMSNYDSHKLDQQTNNIFKSPSTKDYTDSSLIQQFDSKENSEMISLCSPLSSGEVQVITPKSKTDELNNFRKNSESSIIDFEMSVNKTTILVDDDMYDVAIGSQSDDGSVVRRDSEMRLVKTGSLSINEYKDRRKTGQGDERRETSSRRRSSSRSDEKERIFKKPTPSKKDSKLFSPSTKRSGTESQNDALYGSPDPPSPPPLATKSRIPLLDSDVKENGKPHKLDEKTTSIKSIARNESPYNPGASPIDLESPVPSPGSPSNAAVDDDNVEILAYRDVIAFSDIMKSKVKHEAKKHKRKKLEEMKSELEGRGGTKKEKRLVDYLIRQAQVEEMMKNTLKQYFKSKEITKDEYKHILKKAVPQVTMSNSTIIPEKIESLMTKFVRKCKGQRAKEEKERKRRKQQEDLAEQQKELERQLQENAVLIDSLPFGPQVTTALNPNLPLPPI